MAQIMVSQRLSLSQNTALNRALLRVKLTIRFLHETVYRTVQ